jgi:hypothetical protein
VVCPVEVACRGQTPEAGAKATLAGEPESGCDLFASQRARIRANAVKRVSNGAQPQLFKGHALKEAKYSRDRVPTDVELVGDRFQAAGRFLGKCCLQS